MFGITKQLIRAHPAKNNVWMKQSLLRNYRGSVPGCNLPFNLDKPNRLMVIFTLASVIGMGAPFLAFMHLMLRPYDN